MGAQVARKGVIQRMLAAEHAPQQQEVNRSVWRSAIVDGARSEAERRELEGIARSFEERLNRFFAWRFVNQLWGKRRGEPVPDVFPLQIGVPA